MAAGDVHDGVHLAGDARIMHDHDDLRAVGDGRFDLAFVDVHGIGADVHEHQLRPRQHSGRGGAGERIAGQDHLVPRFQVAQQHSHIQRRGAAGGQQDLLRVEAFLQPGVAFFGKGPVAADLMRVDGLFDIVQFIPDAGGHIERDHDGCLLSRIVLRRPVPTRARLHTYTYTSIPYPRGAYNLAPRKKIPPRRIRAGKKQRRGSPCRPAVRVMEKCHLATRAAL